MISTSHVRAGNPVPNPFPGGSGTGFRPPPTPWWGCTCGVLTLRFNSRGLTRVLKKLETFSELPRYFPRLKVQGWFQVLNPDLVAVSWEFSTVRRGEEAGYSPEQRQRKTLGLAKTTIRHILWKNRNPLANSAKDAEDNKWRKTSSQHSAKSKTSQKTGTLKNRKCGCQRDRGAGVY